MNYKGAQQFFFPLQINGRADLHAEVRFATLSEYFDAVKKEAAVEK